MKKISMFLVLIMLLGLLSGHVIAEKGIDVELDGKILNLQGVSAFVDAGSKKVYVPLRAISESLGASVDWDESLMEAVVGNRSETVRLKAGVTDIKVNNESSKLESKVILKSERLYVPISFFAERFGIRASYNEKNSKLELKAHLALLDKVSHFKQSTIKISGEKIIYVDPFSIEGEPKEADIVFVTHTHGDHFSIADIKKTMKDGATLVITADGAEAAKKEGISKITSVEPDKSYEVEGIKFETVPSYNKDKDFHPKANKWVGYIITINSARYYMAGDTDLIPEMEGFKADVAFLPVGGTYTMDANEAAEAANLIKPKVAVPIHFADVVGTVEDAKKFVKLTSESIVTRILK